MADLIKLIKYDGENKELFTRWTVERHREQNKFDTASSEQKVLDYKASKKPPKRVVHKKAQILVPATHVAILVKDGRMLETLEPGKYDLVDKKSGRVNLFNKLGADSVEVIYMSNTARLRMLWGTPQQLDLRDPVTDVMTKIGASGEIEVQVGEPRRFYLQLVGTDRNYNIDMLQERILNRLMSEFKPALAKIMREKQLTYNLVDEYTKEISESIAPILGKIMMDDYGLKLYTFFINKILIPENTKNEIETELLRIKNERKQKQEKEEAKRELAEDLEYLEKLKDKEWERHQYMAELQARDRDRYLEVCKIIGWESSSAKGKAGSYCPRCGSGYDGKVQFCPKCGNQLGIVSLKCAKCGKENSSQAAFCNGCGNALNK